MGRKPNPNGKDRTRTISLGGDVAEIAQRLADQSQLSSVLTDLLRREFGIDTELDGLKAELLASTDERKELQAKEERLINAITIAEEQSIERRTTIVPQLHNQIRILQDRRDDLQDRISRSFIEDQRRTLRKQCDATQLRLDEVLDQLENIDVLVEVKE